MHETMVLNDLLKRIKGVYIPGSNQRDSDQLLHNSKFDLTVSNIDENTRKIHFKAKKPNDKEVKFNQLITDINSVLFYLSNVYK